MSTLEIILVCVLGLKLLIFFVLFLLNYHLYKESGSLAETVKTYESDKTMALIKKIDDLKKYMDAPGLSSVDYQMAHAAYMTLLRKFSLHILGLDE